MFVAKHQHVSFVQVAFFQKLLLRVPGRHPYYTRGRGGESRANKEGQGAKYLGR